MKEYLRFTVFGFIQFENSPKWNPWGGLLTIHCPYDKERGLEKIKNSFQSFYTEKIIRIEAYIYDSFLNQEVSEDYVKDVIKVAQL